MDFPYRVIFAVEMVLSESTIHRAREEFNLWPGSQPILFFCNFCGEWFE
jgi:hypothetical protein